MPSIQDVADQINAKLDNIASSTATTASNTDAIKTAINQTNSRLDSLDAHLQAGFKNLSNGLFALIEIQKAAFSLLDHHRKQNDVIICLLENADELLCDIKRKFARQLDLSTAMLGSVERIEAIEERVHSDAAADFDRHEALEDKIEECCPPDEPEPEPCPDACDTPRYRESKPQGQDWKPLSNREREPVK